MLKLVFCFFFLMLLSLNAVFICQDCPNSKFFFPNTHPLATLAGASAHVMMAGSPLAGAGAGLLGVKGVFSDRAPHPSPIWMQISFGILKRRISPGCILLHPPHTLPGSVQSLELAFLIVCLLKLLVWQLLNASIVHTCCQKPRVCSQGPELCP